MATLVASVIAITVDTTCPLASESDSALIDRQIQASAYVEALSNSVALLREQIAESGPRSPESLDALRRVGLTLRGLGDWELADAVWHLYYSAVYEVYGPCNPHVAEAIYHVAATSKAVSREYVDTLPRYLDALSLLDAAAADQRELIGTIMISQAHYYRRRDTTKSIELFRAAVATLETPELTGVCANARTWLGWTLLHMGRHDEARTELVRARKDFEAVGHAQDVLVGTIESSLADLDVLAGRWAEAERRYRHATTIFATARQEASTRFAEFPLHGYNLLALAQLKQGKKTEAWESLQRYRSPTGKRLASLREWKAKAPASYQQVASARRDVVAMRTLRRHGNDWDPISKVDWKSVLDELDANARLSALEARYYGPEVSTCVSLEELQASLPKDWAYVGWLDSSVGDELTGSAGPILDTRWMYIVRSRGPIRWIPLWEHHDFDALLAARGPASRYTLLLERAAAWSLRVEDDREMKRLAAELAGQDFNRALPFLEDVNQIVVEFFDERSGFRPFEGMIANGEYLGDRFVVSYSPSADAFVASRKHDRGAARTTPVVVALGDAVFSTQPLPAVGSGSIDISHHRSDIEVPHHRAATNGDPEALAKLPRLPYAGIELDRIRKIYPEATILQGVDANEENVRRLFAPTSSVQPDIVHIATHALGETPLRQRCALALSRVHVDGTPAHDGLLDALEIQLGWDLDADLVTLSGCQTASGAGWFRGEPGGLLTVLLGVGAQSVVASLWKVDDLATAHLMTRFYENLSGSYSDIRRGQSGAAMPKAVALAEAKRWVREYVAADGRRPFAHPVYWSGFVLVGDPD